jgi:hypothetical protein
MDTPLQIYPTWDNPNKFDHHPRANPPGVNIAPTAIFKVNATNINMDHDVKFTCTGVDGSHNASFFWDFGDSKNSSIPNPVHKFHLPGNYSVSLLVKDFDGQTSLATRVDLVHVQDLFPVASFTYEPWYDVILYPNQPARFAFTGSFGNKPANITWNFGDGNNSGNETIFFHAYAAPGSYNVTLTITDIDGDVRRWSEIVTVIAQPVPPRDRLMESLPWMLLGGIGVVFIIGILKGFELRSFRLLTALHSFQDDFIDSWIAEPRFSILGIISSPLAHLLNETNCVDGAKCIYERFVSPLP